MRKDTAHFSGSEQLLSLVRSSVTEATMVNETNEQVIFKLIIISKLGITIICLVIIILKLIIGCEVGCHLSMKVSI